MTYAQAFDEDSSDAPRTAAPPAIARSPRPRRRRGSLASTVVAELVDDIVAGRYAADAALPNEADLGTRFGVSRTVIRESVKLLQDRGLVRSHQGVGTVVRDFDAWDLIDDHVLTALVRHDESRAILDELVVVRAALERDMAGLAAAGGAELAGARAAYDRMVERREDAVAFGLADVDFHDAVMVASGNRLGRVVVNRIHDKARTTGRYHGAVTPEGVALTLAEHAAVLDALEGGDAATAATAMHTHITGSWERRRPAQTLREIRRSAAPGAGAGA